MKWISNYVFHAFDFVFVISTLENSSSTMIMLSLPIPYDNDISKLNLSYKYLLVKSWHSMFQVSDESVSGEDDTKKMPMADSGKFFASFLMGLSGDMSKTSSGGSSAWRRWWWFVPVVIIVVVNKSLCNYFVWFFIVPTFFKCFMWVYVGVMFLLIEKKTRKQLGFLPQCFNLVTHLYKHPYEWTFLFFPLFVIFLVLI